MVTVLAAILARTLFVASSTLRQPEYAKVIENYVKAVYSRNFRDAYRWISTLDRQRKDQETYISEQGPFTGFALMVASRLASFIETTPAQPAFAGDHAKVAVKLKLPDVERLAPHLFDWDEEKLNSLSAAEQNAIMETIGRWHKEGQLPFAQVDEKFELVKENSARKILLNWRAGVSVEVATQIPNHAPLEVVPLAREILFQPGVPFTITLKLKNNSQRELRARVAHNVEPKNLEKYLGLANCGSFLPFRLGPGKEDQNNSTFLVWTNLPAEINRFTMIYQFEVDWQD